MATEIIHVEMALSRCGYLKWSFKRVRESMAKKKQEGGTRKKKEEHDFDPQTTVTIPYVKGVSEALNQMF